jgi:predicted amidophosphoribosyltransferase
LTSLAENQGDRIIALESDLEQAQITIRELQGLCYSCGKNSADKGALCWECEQSLEREASPALATKAISDDDRLE